MLHKIMNPYNSVAGLSDKFDITQLNYLFYYHLGFSSSLEWGGAEDDLMFKAYKQ